MSETNDVERLVSAFDGMTDRESVSHQVKHWAAGTPLHNTVRDECCPDFSCCNGGKMMTEAARQKLLQAHESGDDEAVQNICMMGLGGLVADIEAKVYIAGEDQTEH